MFKKGFRIIFNEENNRIVQGEFFEELVAKIIETHRYEVSQRINFTGMEIDLIAKHKDRVNETLYVECKAKDNLSSNDIKSFVFNTEFKNTDFGYFISTTQFAHQVAGLISEINENKKYNNLYFLDLKKS